MAGRGRGRGRGFSFDIQNLGFSRVDEVQQTITGPPPLYPPLVSKPRPLQKSAAGDRKAEILKKLLERRYDDPYGIIAASQVKKKSSVEKYSEKFKPKPYDKYIWDKRLFPAELFTDASKKKKAKPNVSKSKLTSTPRGVKKTVNIQEIEKTLTVLGDKEETNAEPNKEDEEKDSEQEEEILDEEDLDDEELEESTDYISSYFDNGEGYLEDEDNLDDDAVY